MGIYLEILAIHRDLTGIFLVSILWGLPGEFAMCKAALKTCTTGAILLLLSTTTITMAIATINRNPKP